LEDEPSISWHHETIYQYIVRDQKNGGKLYQLLCHQNKTDRKSDGNQHRRHEIPNRVEIDECL